MRGISEWRVGAKGGTEAKVRVRTGVRETCLFRNQSRILSLLFMKRLAFQK